MPTYDYRCDGCGHEFEQFQQMRDPVRRKCPKCGKLKLKRLIGTGAGVLFKGSGFYETDYRSESYKKDAQAERKSATGGDSKDSKDSKASKDGKDSKGSTTKPAAEPKAAKSGKKGASE